MDQITKEQIAEYRQECIKELRHFYETMAVPSPINGAEREHLEMSALSMASKLSQQWRDNCKRSMERKDLKREPSVE